MDELILPVLALFFSETVKIDHHLAYSEYGNVTDIFYEKVADLFNLLLFPVDKILSSQLAITRISSALTNMVYEIVLTNPPMRLSSKPRPPLLTDVSGSGTLSPSPILPSKYILRIYGSGIDELIDHKNELYWINVLGKLGIGARVLGLFNNGRLEEFLFSRTLDKTDIRDPDISPKIASRMCELHKLAKYIPSTNHRFSAFVATDYLVFDPSLNIPQSDYASSELWKKLRNWTALLDKKLDHMQYGNILQLSKTKDLMVVDFEYAGYNYRGADIANHFTEWMADYSAPESHLLSESNFPSKDQRFMFYRSYLSTENIIEKNIEGKQALFDGDLSDETAKDCDYLNQRILEMDKETMQFVPVIHLQWGIWGLLQACISTIEFNYLGYGFHRLQKFIDFVEQNLKNC
ncbi:hypothetical protein BB561_001060 [Smittium simulii]|uniref:Aminoglycoside phosphotransferase domain-containing protein n=1 Tax=Smittium simulii TaxID=133385 RepID=A0A2T9YW85_9FUNG|nr:hypothetical protein BB561_001060 [Smittium simulii]